MNVECSSRCWSRGRRYSTVSQWDASSVLTACPSARHPLIKKCKMAIEQCHEAVLWNNRTESSSLLGKPGSFSSKERQLSWNLTIIREDSKAFQRAGIYVSGMYLSFGSSFSQSSLTPHWRTSAVSFRGASVFSFILHGVMGAWLRIGTVVV